MALNFVYFFTRTFGFCLAAAAGDHMSSTCPICFRENSEHGEATAIIAECGHVMCRSCYLDFTVHRGYSKCPYCRTRIVHQYVENAIGDRPFTRSLPMQVQTDVHVWFSRALSHQLEHNISSEPISHMIFLDLDQIFTRYPHVFCIVRKDVLPIIHRAVIRHGF